MTSDSGLTGTRSNRLDQREADPVDLAHDIDRRVFRVAFASIVGLAAMLRIAYVVIAKRGDEMVGDQFHYFAQAVTIANGHGFEHPWNPDTYSALHAPLTALSLVPASFNDSNAVFQQQLLMAMYGTGVVAGIGFLARYVFTRRVALFATAVGAVYANLWINDGLIMAETLAAAGVVTILLVTYRYLARRTVGRAAIVGLAVGIAGLARAELLLLGPLLMMPAALGAKLEWRHRLGQLALAGAVTVLVIAPWVIRNQVRFEESAFMSTQDGLTLFAANCDDAYEAPLLGFWAIDCIEDIDIPADADESEQSAIYRDAAFRYIGDHTGRLPVVTLARLGRGLSLWETEQMIFLNTGEGREPWASRMGLWQYWALLPLAAYGLWAWPSHRPRWPLVVTAGLSVLVIVAFYGIPRFRIPAEIGIVMCAAVAINALWSRVRVRARPDHRS